MSNKRILFLLPYPLHKAPSQRFRVENLLFLLDEKGFEYKLVPFMSSDTWQILYKKGSLPSKVFGIVKSFLNRWSTVLFSAYRFDYIFIHREAAPIGPPFVEWFLTKIIRKKIIYDFDDAIWIPNTSAENKLAGLVKAFWKVPYICRWSYKVSAGNDYLCSFASQSGAKNVVRIPTVVNTQSRYNVCKQHEAKTPVVGWTGSHSTLKFLDLIVPIIVRLQNELDFDFLVIADKKPDLPIQNWQFCPWNEETEIPDLLKIDVGIMPLKDDAWSEGKCGFKLIQYLSLGIPAVAHSVGVNKQIIKHGKNGFLADTEQDWEQSLRRLITDPVLRNTFGAAGRQKMIQEYSIESQGKPFLNLFS